MSLSRYKTEIALGSQVIVDVAQKVHEAKADDGKIDAGEALKIFSSTLLSVLLGVATVQAGKK